VKTLIYVYMTLTLRFTFDRFDESILSYSMRK
jgi:hypothetical protein